MWERLKMMIHCQMTLLPANNQHTSSGFCLNLNFICVVCMLLKWNWKSGHKSAIDYDIAHVHIKSSCWIKQWPHAVPYLSMFWNYDMIFLGLGWILMIPGNPVWTKMAIFDQLVTFSKYSISEIEIFAIFRIFSKIGYDFRKVNIEIFTILYLPGNPVLDRNCNIW